MPKHEVKQGEHISSLAAKYKFFEFKHIWEDGANADIRAKRDNPNVLNPGDLITIPDKQTKNVTKPTGAKHTFQIKAPKLEVRIVIKTYFDDPVKNTDCVLEVDGAPKVLKTSAAGLIERDIEPTAQKGRLVIRGSDIEVRIGHLDPVTEESGQIARLNNLGYSAGEIAPNSDELFQSAVEEFQADQNIRDGKGKVTGICDSRTQAKLKDSHGC